jgi:hypothetical protein
MDDSRRRHAADQTGLFRTMSRRLFRIVRIAFMHHRANHFELTVRNKGLMSEHLFDKAA